MKEYSQRRKLRQYIYSFPVILILLIILFFVAKGCFGIYQKYSFSKNELNNSKADLVILEEKKSHIYKKVEKLETETGIEKEIRSKFNVAREGEKLVVIVDDAPEEEKVVEEKGFFKKLFNHD